MESEEKNGREEFHLDVFRQQKELLQCGNFVFGRPTRSSEELVVLVFGRPTRNSEELVVLVCRLGSWLLKPAMTRV